MDYGNGYKLEPEYQEFLSKIASMGIDIISLHTSGHADYTAIRQVLDITNPEAVIVIHSENPDGIKAYTDKYIPLQDMETYTLK